MKAKKGISISLILIRSNHEVVWPNYYSIEKVCVWGVLLLIWITEETLERPSYHLGNSIPIERVRKYWKTVDVAKISQITEEGGRKSFFLSSFYYPDIIFILTLSLSLSLSFWQSCMKCGFTSVVLHQYKLRIVHFWHIDILAQHYQSIHFRSHKLWMWHKLEVTARLIIYTFSTITWLMSHCNSGSIIYAFIAFSFDFSYRHYSFTSCPASLARYDVAIKKKCIFRRYCRAINL